MSHNPMQHGQGGQQGQRGSVLLVVLWLLVMLSLIAQGVAQRSQNHLVLARAQIDLTQARLRAQAGVLHGALLLLDPSQSLPSRQILAGTAAPIVFGAPVDIEIIDECGRIDLNTGRADMITALFDGMVNGLLHPEQARRQAQAVLDWRDPGMQPRSQGAERAAYRAAGRLDGPRNGPFEAVAELHQVLGLDAETVARLAPFLTVDCLNGGIDPMAASAPLLRLLPTRAGADSLQAFLDRRDEALRDGDQRMLWPPGLEKFVVPSDGHAYGIRATTRGPKPIVRWSAVVWPGDGSAQSLTFRRWTQDWAGIYDENADDSNSHGNGQRRFQFTTESR